MIMGESYYEMLDITKDATAEEIRISYFEQVRKYHPDTNSSPLAKEMFFHIQEAYEILSDPKKRKVYDQTLLGIIKPESLITLSIEYSKSEIPRLNEPQLVYAKLELQRVEDPVLTKTPQVHICLIVDCSTSMRGERIEMVKKNIYQLILKLRPSDLVSIITFNDKADLLLAPTNVANLKQIENNLNHIICSGATEIYKGLKAGADLLWGNFADSFTKQIILLTDGHTYGDEEACFELVKKLVDKNIIVSTLGIGHEWNDIFLDRLANITGGSSSFVSSQEDLYNYMQNFAESINTVFARGLTMELESGNNIETKYIFRIQPDIAELQLEKPIPLGDMYLRKKSIFLIAFLLPALSRENDIICLGKGKIRLEINSTKIERARILINMCIPVKDEINRQDAPIDIINALSRITLYQMQERANLEVKNGDFQNAVNHLGCIATQLLAQGNKKLAKVALVEAEMLKNTKRYSADGDKQLKYGTRALLLLPDHEKRDL
ncbi:MAG: hypothetical protein C0401_00895 [Anaerolinea sp.]|nr:hypothetical protein [Anaerolinea sp.]